MWIQTKVFQARIFHNKHKHTDTTPWVPVAMNRQNERGYIITHSHTVSLASSKPKTTDRLWK